MFRVNRPVSGQSPGRATILDGVAGGPITSGVANPADIQLSIKAVPGARRDEVVGWLGDRLKVRVSAPPEGGRANEAICALIARELGIRASAVAVTRGHGHPEKTVTITGLEHRLVLERWPREGGPRPADRPRRP